MPHRMRDPGDEPLLYRDSLTYPWEGHFLVWREPESWKPEWFYVPRFEEYRITNRPRFWFEFYRSCFSCWGGQTIEDKGFGWGMYEKQRTAEVPCAEARLWKSEEGTLAIFFANYVDREIKFPYRINPGDYGLPKGTWEIKEIGRKSLKNIGEFTDSLDRTEILEPGMIKVIELVKH